MMQARPALLDGLNEHMHQHPDGVDDAAWMDVINKMDEVYSRLIDDEVELERKNVELEQSQQFIVSVISSMTDVLIVCDVAGRIERANAALCALVGRTESEILGQPLAILLADEASQAKAAEVSKAAFLGLQAQDVELQLLDRGRQAVPVDARCTPRTAGNGRRAGTVWVGRPMGEIKRAYMELQQTHDALKRTQQQLIHSEKMASLGQLVAGVAHELNNPISFVLGNVHALQRYSERLQTYIEMLDGQQDSEALREQRQRLRIDHVLHDLPSLIDGTLEGASRTADIVNGLKRFSTMDKEEKRVVNLVQVVDRTILWMRRVQPQTVQIHWTPTTTAHVLGSEGQLQQVLTNLLQNAFDAIATAKCSQGLVWITLRQADGRVYIHVADNGAGILPEAMSRVFDPFFTSKPVGKGTGLGLSISYGLIEQHQGVLSVRNRNEGGAEFTIDLPQAPGFSFPRSGGEGV